MVYSPELQSNQAAVLLVAIEKRVHVAIDRSRQSDEAAACARDLPPYDPGCRANHRGSNPVLKQKRA